MKNAQSEARNLRSNAALVAERFRYRDPVGLTQRPRWRRQLAAHGEGHLRVVSGHIRDHHWHVVRTLVLRATV